MRVPLVASSLLLILALAGCKSNSLEGKWNVSGGQGLPAGSTATMEFSGGNMTTIVNMKDPRMGEVTATVKGPYKIEGEKLTFNAKEVNVDDSKVSPAIKPMMKQLGLKAQIEKGLKQDNTSTVKFDSSDQVLLTGKQGTTTLTRVK